MEIDTKNKSKKVGIAKMPKFLGNFIQNLNGKRDLGEVVFHEDGRIQLKMNQTLNYMDNLPVEYNLKKVDRTQSNMYVLTSTPDFSGVEGEVDNEFIVTPVINKRYIDYKKSVSVRAVNRTEIIDSMNEGVRAEKMGSLREMEFLARKRKQMLIDKKRERLDKDEVMNIIFNAFEKYESWTVRDLADFTGQPTAFIQEIVNEICDADKKEHKSIYTLKDEYK